MLREKLATVSFDQQDQAAGRARRMAAIFDTLSRGIWSTEVNVIPGSDFGSELANFVSDSLAKRPPQDPMATELAANSIVQFMVIAVRLHGTLAASARNYAFMEPLKRSLGRAQWPEALHAGLDRLAAQVLEQLLFLVKLKIPDNDLRRVYVSIVGEVTARLRLERVTENADDIETDLIFWLRTGSHRRTLPTQRAVEETAVAAVDRDLALAYREAESLRSGLSSVETEAISAAEFHSSRLKDELETALSQVWRLVAHVESAARRRHLVLKGNVGDVVDFSPMEHEPSPDAKGSRVVRVRTHVVERVLDEQSMGVVLKGDVEPT